MFGKTKSKIFSIKSKSLITFALAMLVVGGFVYPKETRAVNFDATGIELHTEIEINGQKDNLIRLVKGQSQPVNFTVILTPTKLLSKDFGNPEYLAFNTDTIDFNTVTHGRRPIQGAGVGVEIAGEGNTCGIKGISSWIPLTGRSDYLTCNYPGGKQLVSSNTLNLNQEYRFNFSLSGASVNALKLDRPCVRGGQTTGCFTVVPFLNIEVALGPDSNIAFNAAAKDIYVQLFNSQQELDAAVQSGQRPADVPNYGGITGAGSTSKGGSALLGFLNQILGMLVGLIQEFIFLVFYWLIAPLIQAVLSIRTYTDGFAGVIYPGWVVVRNVSNIFFIVALIAIGMGTLFRLESYQYRHLLVQLIIAALLVNFSLVIAQAILGVADTVQNQFLPNNVEVIRALAKDMMLNYRSAVYDGFFNFAQKGYFANTIQPLFYLALALGSFLVFLAIAAFLVIRIVMLWVLLMVSPIAYVAGVLPATAKYRSEWWSTFLKYAFFTPIMAFFLNMAAVISTAQQKNPVLQRVLSDPTVLGTDSSFAGFVFKVSSNIILLVFLVIALKVAEQAGIYGASAITGLAKKGMFAPFTISGAGIKSLGGLARRTYTKMVGTKILDVSMEGQAAADRAKKAEIQAKLAREKGDLAAAEEWSKQARKAQRLAQRLGWKSAGFRALSFLDPRVVKEAWKQRTHRKEMQAYQPAVGNMLDTFNRIIPTEWFKAKSLKGKQTYHGLIAKRGVVDTEAKELLAGIRTREEAARVLAGALKSGDKDEIEAALKALQANNQQDDWQNIEGQTFSIMNYMDEIVKLMREKGFSEEEIVTIMSDLQETGEGQGRLRTYGYVGEDKDGVVRLANDLGYYNNLSRDQQVEELRKMAKQMDVTATETKSEEFRAVANKLDEVANKLQNGVPEYQGKSFEQILEEANYKNSVPEAQQRDDMNLKRVVSSLRFWGQMNTKMRRGRSGTHAQGLEAAVITDQELDGWLKQNFLGKVIMHNMPPSVMRAFINRIHEAQARTVVALGGLQDPVTGQWELPDLEVINRTDEQIAALANDDPHEITLLQQQRHAHKMAMERVKSTRQMSKQIFDTLVTSNNLFNDVQRRKFKKQFDEQIAPAYGWERVGEGGNGDA